MSLLWDPGTSTDIPGHDDPRFIPSGSPAPGVDVRAVAILEEDPLRQHWVRAGWGWTLSGEVRWSEGVAARKIVPWSRVGVCWSGTQHDLKDVTGWADVS